MNTNYTPTEEFRCSKLQRRSRKKFNHASLVHQLRSLPSKQGKSGQHRHGAPFYYTLKFIRFTTHENHTRKIIHHLHSPLCFCTRMLRNVGGCVVYITCITNQTMHELVAQTTESSILAGDAGLNPV